MESSRIFNTEEVEWQRGGSEQLNYQVVFEGNGREPGGSQGRPEEDTPEASNEQTLRQEDLKELLSQRDRKWKIRMKNAREVAFKKGLERGKKQGFARAEREIDRKIRGLEGMLAEAHEEWRHRQEALAPGLLDLVFDMVEKVVGIPFEDRRLRDKMEEELAGLLHQADSTVKPVLSVSERDYAYAQELLEKYAPELSLSIRTTERCNPGEFEFETDRETVVYRFKEQLRDFRDNLNLPSWE